MYICINFQILETLIDVKILAVREPLLHLLFFKPFRPLMLAYLLSLQVNFLLLNLSATVFDMADLP